VARSEVFVDAVGLHEQKVEQETERNFGINGVRDASSHLFIIADSKKIFAKNAALFPLILLNLMLIISMGIATMIKLRIFKLFALTATD